MGIFNFFCGKKLSQNKENDNHRTKYNEDASTINDNLFTREELEGIISTLSTISYLFRDSVLLQSTGGNRNEKMMSRTHSYVGIFGYYYEEIYHYGSFSKIVDNNIMQHYRLIKIAMDDSNHHKNTISELADNWSDVLQVIFNFQLEQNVEGDKFSEIKDSIHKVTIAIEKLSNKECRKPSDPRKAPHKVVTYNPYNITEDLNLSQGCAIPDITEVFAKDLIPKLFSDTNRSPNKTTEIVVSYTIEMIKSYYNNAGYVPMVIVDQIVGQINQVVSMMVQVSYAPYSSLKEFVLSKIYK